MIEVFTRPHAPAAARRARRISLTTRILAVNAIALGLLAGSLFYLDSYRNQLMAERSARARDEADIIAVGLAAHTRADARALLAGVGTRQHLRLRLFAKNGKELADSFALAPPSFAFADPTKQPALAEAARALDRGMDALLGTPALGDYRESADDALAGHWPELAQAALSGHTVVRVRYAPDRTPVLTAATKLADGRLLLVLRNATDITQRVRDARQTLAIIVGLALAVSIALSLFLARTIVEPLRKLVRAAVRVRLGRDRAVVVPRLPDRRDEIGLLARAISDMTAALRQRIDAMEHFAADVAHEIKNPLASLRSALETLAKVEEPSLRRQLMAIAAHDVTRIDRLITEIADASRIDAELSRTTFEPVDLHALASALVGARERRGANAGRHVSITRRGAGPCVVACDPPRLERVFENLLDNAVSFTPPGSAISLTITDTGQADDSDAEMAQNGVARAHVITEICDEGPGIAADVRDRVFERFHSLRPAGEDFGSHSGLGLAIARTIVEAHDGTLEAREPHRGARANGMPGARLVMELPVWRDGQDLP